MKKVIRLTESDLTKLVKRVIVTEQASKILSGLFKRGASLADDIVSKYGDDFASKLSKALSSPKNITNVGGVNYLMSASGSKVPMSQVEDALQLISSGKLAAEDVANLLPRQLADGSEFRSLIVNTKPKIGGLGSTATGSVKLSNFPSNTVVSNSTFADNMVNWANVSNAKNMSDYNKLIASALQSGNFNMISRGGFEKYGIPNFREFLMKSVNKDKKIMFSPQTGQWYFQTI